MGFSDQLAIAGLVSAVILAILGFYSPAIWARWRERKQIYEIWASIDELWRPEDNNLHSKVLTGGRLVVRNPTPWPVRDVIVLKPDHLTAQNFELIGPRSKVELRLPAQLTSEIRAEPLILQVTDSHGLVWRWNPLQGKANLLSQRMDHLSRIERWAARNVRSRVVAPEPPVQQPPVGGE